MMCAECDKLDRLFIKPLSSRSMHFLHGTLTPELELRFDEEENATRNAIFDHRIKDHKVGDRYE